MKKLLILSLLLVTLLPAASQKLSGSWLGKLTLNGGKNVVRLVLHFSTDENGNDRCILDSPDQGAKNIPAAVNYITADSVIVTVPAISMTYCGKIGNGQITGTLHQSGQALPLTFAPGTATSNRPQTPQPPFAYRTEEVRFANEADSVTLSGTLTYPVGYNPKKAKTTPIVLMVTGSGTQNRDEEIFGHKPFFVIADFLARHGIASLRYDDRGAGGSTGDRRLITTASNLRDAMAGIRYLRATKAFGKTGMLGHSEGGTIAFMAAARHAKALDFIVSMAGCGVRGDSILVYQNRNALAKSGMPDSITNNFCRVLSEVFNYKITHPAIHNAAGVVDSLCTGAGISLPVMLRATLPKILSRGTPWMEHFVAFAPSADVAATRCPVLALNGCLDRQVPPALGTAAIKHHLPRHRHTLIKDYPGLNHLFQHCATGQSEEYFSIEETISEEVLADIARWINDL